MIRLIAVAGFALALATSAQAMTPAPIPQPDGMVMQVAAACGPGRTRVSDVCVAGPPSATLAEPSAGVCDGTEAFALGTSELHRTGIDIQNRRTPRNAAARAIV